MINIKKALQGRWPEILKDFSLPPITGRKHYSGPCPMCGKKRKFRIDDKGGLGTWICVCGSGDGIELIKRTQSLDFIETVTRICQLLGIDMDNETKQVEKLDQRIQKEAYAYFDSLFVLKGSDAEKYLVSRGLKILPHNGVRYSKMEFSGKGQPKMPAMVAYATTNRGKILYKHCTYIINGSKLKSENPKKMFSVVESEEPCAIKLFKEEHILGIAEGIETALSVKQMFNVPTWATINPSFMKKFVAPKGVVRLNIYADNDSNGTGLEAAFSCGRKNILNGNDVVQVNIFWPKRYETDFNDTLVSGYHDIFQWTLYK